MTYDSEMHHRHSIRLKDYDYSSNGGYFITICTYDRACIFGEIVNDAMHLSRFGEIVSEEWAQTETIRQNVILDVFVVMPNHLHGVIFLDGDLNKSREVSVGATRRIAPTTARPTGPPSGSISAIVGQFKSIVTKQINHLRQNNEPPIWQRNYYERIIRNKKALDAIRQYIVYNPQSWASDEDNPTVFEKRLRRK
jgi:REP element-mobilizing transposase RayT